MLPIHTHFAQRALKIHKRAVGTTLLHSNGRLFLCNILLVVMPEHELLFLTTFQ